MGPRREPSLVQEENLNRLRFGTSDSQLVAGIVAGFIATQMATIVGFWNEVINFPVMDWNRFNGTYEVGFSNPTAVGFGVPPAGDLEVFIVGWVSHSMSGMILSLVFVFLMRQYIPLPYTLLGNLGAAMVWASILAVISFSILTPLIDPYQADPGWFSLDLKLPDTNDVEGALHPGWKTTAAIILWHWVYGFHLGSFYQPKDDGTAAA